MTREEIYNEIRETLGSVTGPFEKMDDAKLAHMWDTLKKTFLAETSLGMKVNALVSLAAAYGLECKY